MGEGLWKAKAARRPVIHQLRERRARLGELVQIDGSPHDWFEGRAPKVHAAGVRRGRHFAAVRTSRYVRKATVRSRSNIRSGHSSTASTANKSSNKRKWSRRNCFSRRPRAAARPKQKRGPVPMTHPWRFFDFTENSMLARERRGELCILRK